MTGARLSLLAGNRDFSRFWCGQALSALGTSISGIALPLLVLSLTGSAVAAGGVLTVRLLVLNVARLPGGVLADRWSRRTVMIWTDLAKTLLWIAPLVLLATHAHNVRLLLVVAVVDGLISAVYNPSLGGALRRLVDRDGLLSAVSLNESRSYAAGLIGPPLGGALFEVARWAPFAVDAVTYLVCALLAMGIRTDLGGRIPAQRDLLRDMWVGVRFVIDQPFLRLQTLWSALLNFTTAAAFFGLIPLLRQHGLPSSRIGLVSAGVSLGALLGAAAAPRLARGRPYPVLLGCSLVTVLTAALAAVLPGPVTLTAALMLIAAAGPVLIVLMTTQTYELIPDEMMARAQSSMLLLGSSIYPFASVAMGYSLQHWGARPAYAAVAAGLLACLALCLPTPIRDQLPNPPSRSATAKPAPI